MHDNHCGEYQDLTYWYTDRIMGENLAFGRADATTRAHRYRLGNKRATLLDNNRELPLNL